MTYHRKKDCIYRDPKTGRIMEHKHYATRIFWSKQMLDDLSRLYPITLNDELAGYLGVSPRTMIRKARELGIYKDPDWLNNIFNQRRKWAQMAARRKGYPGGFRKGQHHNPAGEFKKGHVPTPEQQQRRVAGLKKWCRENPKKLHEKAMKTWETRRKNQSIKKENQKDIKESPTRSAAAVCAGLY